MTGIVNSTGARSGVIGTIVGTAESVVKQVLSTTKTTEFSTSSVSNTWTAVTDLSVVITPASTSNKILVTYHINLGMEHGGHTGVATGLYRGGSALSGAVGTSLLTSQTAVTTGVLHFNDDSNEAYNGVVSMTHLDSPSSTSALTYQVYVYNGSGAGFIAYVNRGPSNSEVPYVSKAISSITAMEIVV